MEKEPQIDKSETQAEEPAVESSDSANEHIRIIDGVKYHRVESGYTVRQYFSHHTEGVGPGGGWDRFIAPGGPESVIEELGLDMGPEELRKQGPGALPDTPYYKWEPVEK